jgi:hypothetical protein
MPPLDEDHHDEQVPELAVQALTAAHRRAVAAGHPVVFVRAGQLVRLQGNQITVLKPIRGRQKIAFRVKRRLV